MTATAHFAEPHILSDGRCYCTCDDCTDENGACICTRCQDIPEHPHGALYPMGS